MILEVRLMAKSGGISKAGRPLIIEGKRVSVSYLEIPIEHVELDAHNPRINYLRVQKDGQPLKPKELRDFVLDLPGVSDLFKGIRDNGGLMEPIIMHGDRVVEGNCRAAIFKKLHELKPDDGRWARIPAAILPTGTTEREIAVLQGMYHVNGKIQWRAYLQAAHLHDMKVRLKMSSPAIAKSLSLQQRVVDRLLKAYQAMTEYVPQVKSGKGLEFFSYFEELFKIGKLEKFRNDHENVKLFAKLVKEKKIPLGQNVRDLPALLEQPKVFQKLITDGYKDARAALGATDPSKVYPVFKQVRETRELLESLQAHELSALQKQPAQQGEIRGLYRAIKKVAVATQIDLG
jgi:hypothetical protein